MASRKPTSLRLPGASEAAGEASPSRAPTRGVLDGLGFDGTIRVRTAGRVVSSAVASGCSDAELLAAIRARAEVLLVFLDDDPDLPVIVGVLRHRLAPETGGEAVRERFIDLEASAGIRLRSGDASVELRSDGRIEIRGTEVVSAADTTNRILGGTVAIN